MTTAEDIIELIESTGLAYIHSSGCAVLKNGTWLQPEQWELWLEHLKEGEKGMLTQEQKDRAARVIGTSASDCETEMVLSATTSPVTALATVAETLHYMNASGIEKISHRKALMKAGRKALNVLGDL